MRIEYKGYFIAQEEGRFNLIKKVVSTKRLTGEEYDNEKILGYGYTFEKAIEALIIDIFADKDETMTLRGFIQAYKNEVNELKQAITL